MRQDGTEYRGWYKTYVVALFTLVFAINFIDRQILVILQDPIKQELGLSDTQLGLLSGTAFAIFFVISGLPIAALAERKRRVTIAGVSLILWSLMTAASGLCRNYTQLLIARLGVGIGEAGGNPPLLSLLSDYFDKRTRPLAIGIYSSGIYIGILAAFLIGATVASKYGWRQTFLIVGLPGVFVGVLLMLTVREPARRLDDPKFAGAGPGSYRQLIGVLKQRPLFWLLTLGGTFRAFVGYGAGNFLPSYFLRYHDMSVAEMGMGLAFATGGGGALGAIIGGVAAARMARRDPLATYRVCAITGFFYVPVAASVVLVADAQMALALQFAAALLYTSYYGLFVAECLSMVRHNQRAMASALIILVLNVIGLGMGPAFTGIVSDLAVDRYGTWSVGAAILATEFFGIVSFGFFLAALMRAKKDIASPWGGGERRGEA